MSLCTSVLCDELASDFAHYECFILLLAEIHWHITLPDGLLLLGLEGLIIPKKHLYKSFCERMSQS